MQSYSKSRTPASAYTYFNTETPPFFSPPLFLIVLNARVMKAAPRVSVLTSIFMCTFCPYTEPPCFCGKCCFPFSVFRFPHEPKTG